MTRLENFREKGFFAHAIVSLVKLDKGCSFTPLWTYFYAIGDVLFRYWGFTLALLGIHSCAIGDSLFRYWGLTLALLGIHSSCFPVFLSSFPNDFFVITPMSLRSDFDGLYVVK